AHTNREQGVEPHPHPSWGKDTAISELCGDIVGRAVPSCVRTKWPVPTPPECSPKHHLQRPLLHTHPNSRGHSISSAGAPKTSLRIALRSLSAAWRSLSLQDEWRSSVGHSAGNSQSACDSRRLAKHRLHTHREHASRLQQPATAPIPRQRQEGKP